MRPVVQLDYAIFQLTPTRTRCELFVSGGGRLEKLAAGLVKPFLDHSKILQEKIANGGYSIRLEPPDPKSASWLTRGTMERFVRFVSTPEVLERVSTVEMELIQLEETKNLHANESSHEDNSAKTTLVVYSPAGGNTTAPVNPPSLDKPSTMKVNQDSSEATEKEEAENARKRLLGSLDARQVMLQKEQGMAFARAAAAGFTIDSMADLVVFAECFGASRLRDACIRFIELCKKRQEAGLWQEDMALIATEAATVAQGDINGGTLTNSKPFPESWPDINRLHDIIYDKSCDADMLQRQGSFDSSVETNENHASMSQLRSGVDPSNMPSRENSEEANLQFPLPQRYPEGYQGSPYGIAWQDQSSHPHLMHGAIPSPYLQQAYGYGDLSRTPQLGHPLYYMQTGNLAYPEMINAPPRWWGSDAGPNQFAPYFPSHHQGYYYGDMPQSEAYGDYLHPAPTSTNHGEFLHSVHPFTHGDYPDAIHPHLPSRDEAHATYVLPESQPKREEQNIISESVDSKNVTSTQLNDKCQSEEEACSPSDDKVDLSSVEKVSRRSSQRSSQRSSRRSPSPRRSSSPLRRIQIGRSRQRKPGMVVIHNINHITSKMENQLAKEREVGGYESSNSCCEENDSAGSDGGSICSKVESARVRVQDVIGIFENSAKSQHHSKMHSSRRASDMFPHKEESFIKNSVLGELKDGNANVSGRSVSVGSKEEMETLGVKQESLKESMNGLQNMDMDLVIERGELPAKPEDSLLINFNHDAQINEQNVVTEEDPLIQGRGEVGSYGQNLQVIPLSNLEALPKQSNNNDSIADEALVFSEKNESHTMSATISVPEIIAEQEGTLCIPKTIDEEADLLVVSSRQMDNNGRSNDMEKGLADFDLEVMGGGQEKMNNRDLPDDSLMVPARITEQEKGSVGWRTDMLVEAELPGNGINNQDSESDLKNLEPFEPEDLAMLPERDFGSNLIDNSPNAIVDCNFQMLADITENGSSILVDQDNDENVLQEEQNANANEDVPLKGNGKKSEQEAKMQTVQEALEKRKAEAQARAEKLRAFKASLQKSKKEKEEEERKRIEELKLQRKERIAARATLASPNTQSISTPHQRVKSQVVSQGKSDLSSGRRSNNYVKATASSVHASSLSSLGTKSLQGLDANENGSTHSAKAQKYSRGSENLMTKSTSSLVGSEKEIRRDSSVRSSTGSLRFSIPNMSKQGSTNHNKSMAEGTATLRRHSLPVAQIDKVLKASKKGDRQSRHEPKPSVRKSHSNEAASPKPKPKPKSKSKSTKKMGKTITLDPVPLAPQKSKDDDERMSGCSPSEPSSPTEITTKMEVKTVGTEDSHVGVEYKDGPDIDFDIACNDVSLVEVENTVNTVDIQSIISNTAEPELMSFLQPPEDTNDLAKPLSPAFVHVTETTYQAPIAQLPIDPPSVFPPSDATLHEMDVVPAVKVAQCTSSSASAFVTDSQNMNPSDKTVEEPVSSVLDSLDHSVSRSAMKSVILEKPAKEKEHVKGFRKLLKFGRKSKSGVSSSVSTLEDDVNTEVITDTRTESLEDFSSKLLSKINEDAPTTFTSKLQDNNVENSAVASSAGNGAVTLSQMISQEEYSQPKGTRSFFSLGKFRSKGSGSDSKPR